MSGSYIHYRRVRTVSNECVELEDSWIRHGDWSGIPIAGRRVVGRWAIFAFDGEIPNEIVPLLPGEECDRSGRLL